MSNWDQFFSRPKVFFMTHPWIFKRFNVEYLENISQMQEGTIKYTPIKYICSKKEGGVKAKVYIYYLYDVILLLKIVQARKRCLKITKSERSYFMNGFKYETCKNFLGSLTLILDEHVYATLIHLIWNTELKYDDIVMIVASFHQLRTLDVV